MSNSINNLLSGINTFASKAINGIPIAFKLGNINTIDVLNTDLEKTTDIQPGNLLICGFDDTDAYGKQGMVLQLVAETKSGGKRINTVPMMPPSGNGYLSCMSFSEGDHITPFYTMPIYRYEQDDEGLLHFIQSNKVTTTFGEGVSVGAIQDIADATLPFASEGSPGIISAQKAQSFSGTKTFRNYLNSLDGINKFNNSGITIYSNLYDEVLTDDINGDNQSEYLDPNLVFERKYGNNSRGRILYNGNFNFITSDNGDPCPRATIDANIRAEYFWLINNDNTKTLGYFETANESAYCALNLGAIPSDSNADNKGYQGRLNLASNTGKYVSIAYEDEATSNSFIKIAKHTGGNAYFSTTDRDYANAWQTKSYVIPFYDEGTLTSYIDSDGNKKEAYITTKYRCFDTMKLKTDNTAGDAAFIFELGDLNGYGEYIKEIALAGRNTGNYTKIIPNWGGGDNSFQSTIYLPTKTGSSYLTFITTNTADVGSALHPIYVNQDGELKTCAMFGYDASNNEKTKPDSNRLIYRNSGTTYLSTANHYINDTKIAINSTSEPTENLYVNGDAYFYKMIANNGVPTINETTYAEDCLQSRAIRIDSHINKDAGYNPNFSALPPYGNNANTLITVNRAAGAYVTQMGLTSKGIFYRAVDNGTNTLLTKNDPWNQLIYRKVNSGSYGDGAASGSTQQPIYIKKNGEIDICNGVALGKNSSGSGYSVEGWYRIATSNIGIANCTGTFEIVGAGNGRHTTTILTAAISYGKNPTIQALQTSSWSTPAITRARIVYHTTYTNNYAYLEIYCKPTTSATISITTSCFGGTGWNLLTTPEKIDTTVPSGYSQKAINLTNRAIMAESLYLSGAANVDSIYSEYGIVTGTEQGAIYNELNGITSFGLYSDPESEYVESSIPFYLYSSLSVDGNLTANNTLEVVGVTTISDTTDSTAAATGALQVSGGAYIAQQLRVGTSLTVSGNTTLGDAQDDKITINGKTILKSDVTYGTKNPEDIYTTTTAGSATTPVEGQIYFKIIS